ncbi:MAG: aminopeptidase P family protein [Pseudomonadota bacterium]
MRSMRPDFLTLENGVKATLPFSPVEYANRLSGLRRLAAQHDVDAVVLTSMANVAYYSGFLYCSFGRPYACVVTHDRCVTVSANIDGGQPWRRSVGDNVIYTDWRRNNFWRAIRSVTGRVKTLGIEGDHIALSTRMELDAALNSPRLVDVSNGCMHQRMRKSPEEIALIRAGARIADLGGAALRDAVREGVSELAVTQAGRDVVEAEIGRQFPDAEIRDSWVWFQSGLNTDGAHNPVTMRTLEDGDLLSMNVFPMTSGYYTALERTLTLGEPDAATLRYWNANVAVHELGLSLIRPGAVCAEICKTLNAALDADGLLQYRSFGYGHSFGVLSHYYGREAGLELREDVATVLEPGMVVSMEPMLTIPFGQPGAGGYREHDILVVTDSGAENLTGFPFGPDHNVVER